MTREEAIEKVRRMSLPKETMEILEALAPELRESEDERTRKEILHYILYKADGVSEEEEHRWIAYLEKQKEPTTEELYAEAGTTEKEYIANTMKMVRAMREKQKEQKPILEVFGFKVGDAVRLKDGDGRKHIIKSFEEVEGIHGPNFYHVEFEDNSARDGIYPGEEYPNGYYTQMEKFEEEQKPAEWDDYTKTNLDRAIQIIKKAKGNLQGYQTDDGIYECDKAIEALEHFLYRGLEIEKPAEWGEDDQLIGFIFDLLNDLVWRKDFAMSKEECLERLKSLRPQPKQEWSHDDTQHRNKILLDLRNRQARYAEDKRKNWKDADFYDCCMKDNGENIEWLESLPKRFNLRPSWKPSKEQMEALKKAVNKLANSDVADSVRLSIMYDNLKKLI